MKIIDRNKLGEYLTSKNYSIGRNCGFSPRGIKYGDFDIMKWRNLNNLHKLSLDGLVIDIEDKSFIIDKKIHINLFNKICVNNYESNCIKIVKEYLVVSKQTK